MSEFTDNANTDNAFLSYAQSGNNEQISIALKKYRYLVDGAVSKYITPSLDHDDLIQEGMIGLLAAVKSFDSTKGASFKTYALTCINNSIQTALRKFNRLKDIPVHNVIEYQEEQIPEQNGSLSAEDLFIAQESVSLLTKALRKNLSDFENEVLSLHIAGCSYNEIAKRLCKTPKAVDNALQRIRKKLAKVFL